MLRKSVLIGVAATFLFLGGCGQVANATFVSMIQEAMLKGCAIIPSAESLISLITAGNITVNTSVNYIGSIVEQLCKMIPVPTVLPSPVTGPDGKLMAPAPIHVQGQWGNVTINGTYFPAYDKNLKH